MTEIDLDTCARCGGILELEGGEDHADGGFAETYRCESCDETGVYRVDAVHAETALGVVRHG
ncbi:MAG: hypothetical protein ACOC42_00915 [Halobacteriota archaeon]